MEEQREAHVMTQNGGCTSALAPKNDLFLGPFDMKNGFDAKWIFGKKPFSLIFMTKMVFFPV